MEQVSITLPRVVLAMLGGAAVPLALWLLWYATIIGPIVLAKAFNPTTLFTLGVSIAGSVTVLILACDIYHWVVCARQVFSLEQAVLLTLTRIGLRASGAASVLLAFMSFILLLMQFDPKYEYSDGHFNMLTGAAVATAVAGIMFCVLWRCDFRLTSDVPYNYRSRSDTLKKCYFGAMVATAWLFALPHIVRFVLTS